MGIDIFASQMWSTSLCSTPAVDLALVAGKQGFDGAVQGVGQVVVSRSAFIFGTGCDKLSRMWRANQARCGLLLENDRLVAMPPQSVRRTHNTGGDQRQLQLFAQTFVEDRGSEQGGRVGRCLGDGAHDTSGIREPS